MIKTKNLTLKDATPLFIFEIIYFAAYFCLERLCPDSIATWITLIAGILINILMIVMLIVEFRSLITRSSAFIKAGQYNECLSYLAKKARHKRFIGSNQKIMYYAAMCEFHLNNPATAIAYFEMLDKSEIPAANSLYFISCMDVLVAYAYINDDKEAFYNYLGTFDEGYKKFTSKEHIKSLHGNKHYEAITLFKAGQYEEALNKFKQTPAAKFPFFENALK